MKATMMPSMVIDINDEQLHMLTRLQVLADATLALDFALAAELCIGIEVTA